MALAVVTVPSGGLAVVEVAAGLPVAEASNARGIAVTKVVGKPGLPVTYTVGGATSGGDSSSGSGGSSTIGSTAFGAGGGPVKLTFGAVGAVLVRFNAGSLG
jgi:hypothetical protein